MYARTHIHMHTHTHTYLHIHTHANTNTNTNTHTHAQTRRHTDTHINTRVHQLQTPRTHTRVFWVCASVFVCACVYLFNLSKFYLNRVQPLKTSMSVCEGMWAREREKRERESACLCVYGDICVHVPRSYWCIYQLHTPGLLYFGKIWRVQYEIWHIPCWWEWGGGGRSDTLHYVSLNVWQKVKTHKFCRVWGGKDE